MLLSGSNSNDELICIFIFLVFFMMQFERIIGMLIFCSNIRYGFEDMVIMSRFCGKLNLVWLHSNNRS